MSIACRRAASTGWRCVAKLKALRLARAAELVESHIAGTKWSTKRYMNMDLLTQMRDQTPSASATA